LGSPAGDEGAHGTAAATDPRPLIDRVSESGDIEPGRAGDRCTLRTGDHLPLARLVRVADVCADGESQRYSEPCLISEKHSLAWEPSRFHIKRQVLSAKYLSSHGERGQYVTPLERRRRSPKSPVHGRADQV
jgi:hypothetical protein